MHEIIEQLDQKCDTGEVLRSILAAHASAGFGVSSPCLSKGATNG